MTEKLIRDGQVAVLYSPGWGAGWSTWNKEWGDDLVFDKDIALAIVEGRTEDVKEIIYRKYPPQAKVDNHGFEYMAEIFLGGVENLKVMWLPEGTQFRIAEYDGSEGVVVYNPNHYLIA